VSGFRFDEFTESWVAVAGARRGLPIDPAVRRSVEPPPEVSARGCPFCPGAESELEPTVAAFCDDAGAWHVRAVRNRYPIVRDDAALPAPAPGGRELPAAGVHEVLIETRAHALDWPDFDPPRAALVARMYRDRVRALAALPAARSVALFRNRGRRAGSSQSHPHAQVLATAMVPHGVAQRDALARRHFERTHGSLLGATLERELALGLRIVEETARFVTLCPYAPHRNYETWIVPRAPVPAVFADLSDEDAAALGIALSRATGALRTASNGADYNLVLRAPPLEAPRDGAMGWHLELLPRTGGDAGFELSTGVDVVSTSPEQAAAELRASVPIAAP
jgi:UDPglucose--hexose-1-phosphate uridylyltransferase